ncbi:hypothetical protein [Candidatus Pyrohabitans sp.]
MFGEEEFRQALRAYEAETSKQGGDEFTSMRRGNKFFADITSREAVEEQIRLFIGIISGMDRDSYAARYVVQTFLLDFCRYLDKDFLFNLTDHATFSEMKEALRDFTGEIYEANKHFTQNISLHSLEHLLEDYGTLLKFADRGIKKRRRTVKRKKKKKPEVKEEESGPFTGLWGEEGKLW